MTSDGPKLCTRTAFIAIHLYTQCLRCQISSRLLESCDGSRYVIYHQCDVTF